MTHSSKPCPFEVRVRAYFTPYDPVAEPGAGDDDPAKLAIHAMGCTICNPLWRQLEEREKQLDDEDQLDDEPGVRRGSDAGRMAWREFTAGNKGDRS